MRDMEYYETKKHEGPDYETFMRIANDVLWSAIRDYIDRDASVYLDEYKTVAFVDIVKSIEEGQLVIYACIVKDKEQATFVMNHGLINAMSLRDNEVDLAMTYICKFSTLLRTTLLMDACRGIAEDYDPSRPETGTPYVDEDNYMIIPKTPEEIEQTVIDNMGRMR